MTGTLPWTNPYLLAPMAGISTPGFRGICREFGAGGTSTGLVDAQGLGTGSRGSLKRALPEGRETSRETLQIFGRDPRIISMAAGRAAELGFAALELNLGCTARPVFARGCGAALLGDLDLVARLLEALREATPLPCGIKCRSGLKRGDRLLPELLGLASAQGLDWVSVHLRSVEQGFDDKADWESLDALAAAGPGDHGSPALLAGGDLRDGPAARGKLERHPFLAAVLIGRAAITAPWIFAECGVGSAPGAGERARPPDDGERVRVLAEVLRCLSAELDWRESSRILPLLVRHMELDLGDQPQFWIADRNNLAELRERIARRLARSPIEPIRGNPFLR